MVNVASLILLCATLATCQEFARTCGDSASCVEKELVTYVDKLEEIPSITIIGDYVTLKKSNNVQEISPRANEDIIDRSLRFLSSHEIGIKLPANEVRSFETENRSSKLKKILLPLLLLLKLKAAIIIPIVLSAVALLAFKGLGASLIALAVSGAVGLKSLLEHHGSKVSYEIVPPISPHWSRAGLEASAQVSGIPAAAYQYE